MGIRRPYIEFVEEFSLGLLVYKAIQLDIATGTKKAIQFKYIGA